MRYLFFLIFLQSSVSFGQQVILSTDFQQGIPVSYSILDNDLNTPAQQVAEFTDAWISIEDPEFPGDTVAASTSFFEPVGTADRWLITPPLSLGSYGNFIQWNARSQDASWPDDYLVVISTTNNDWTSFTDTIGYILEENVDWTTRQINLSEQGYADQQVYVAFVNVTEDGYKLYLDDISVRIDDPVGISENNLKGIKAYPNPTSEIIHFSISDSFEYIEIYTVNGQKMGTYHSNQIDIREFSEGIYFAKIFSNEKSATIRFQKN